MSQCVDIENDDKNQYINISIVILILLIETDLMVAHFDI